MEVLLQDLPSVFDHCRAIGGRIVQVVRVVSTVACHEGLVIAVKSLLRELS